MSPGVICSVTIMALMTTTIFQALSADDYNEKCGDDVKGKGLDNRLVGNWKKRNKERKHLSDPSVKSKKVMDIMETGGRGGRSM